MWIASIHTGLLRGIYLSVWMVISQLSTGMGIGDTYTSRVTVARCHLNCMTQFNRLSVLDCRKTSQCNECFNVCGNLVMKFSQSSYLCNKSSLCKPGCLKACSYIRNLKPEIRHEQDLLRRPLDLWVTATNFSVKFSWSRMEKTKRNVMFVLLYKSRGSTVWKYLQQVVLKHDEIKVDGSTKTSWVQNLWTEGSMLARLTSGHGTTANTTITTEDVDIQPFSDTFRLIAVTVDGTVGDTIFPPDTMTVSADVTAVMQTHRINRQQGIRVNMTQLNYTIMASITFRQPSVSRHSSEVNLYTVIVNRGICNIYASAKVDANCGRVIYNKKRFIGRNQTQVTMKLAELRYNTKYKIRVRYSPGKVKVGVARFNTPRCTRVKISGTRQWCMSHSYTSLISTTTTAESALFKNVIVPTKKYRFKRNKPVEVSISQKSHTFETILAIRQSRMNKTLVIRLKIYRHNCSLYANVKPACKGGVDITRLERVFNSSLNQMANVKLSDLWYNTNYEIKIIVADTRGRREQYAVDFNTPLCLNVKENQQYWCVRNDSAPKSKDTIEARVDKMIYDSSSYDRVVVYLQWLPALHHPHANYTIHISYRRPDDCLHFDIVDATSTGGKIYLNSNDTYQIIVMAEGGGEQIISETLVLGPDELSNATRVTEPFNDQHTLITNHKNEKSVKLTWWLIAVTGVIAVTCIGIVLVFLYRKRKNFKDVIITKNFPLQCNNYMYKNTGYAAVSSKTYYTNEFMYVADDWEIDPTFIQFSSTLGQGAFGKVMTAFVGERRVAVKVVREGAPVTYKEDLLAEINLMKKLGCHPNIVSLIGACTQCEPIALVMEYVPYGNLQTFLKKCRLESELRRMDGARGEMTYHMIDAHGSIEEGVITPADILTFARQVAMAMEYLAEKKYVHRDLAARNILLDYNKVVKVCDFGLSRDIFNSDNQYKKLTNGKLPLKWMALESLRDRVFTTSSDVWSFGILLWEIVTMGASPYPHIALADLFCLLSNGFRMDKPSNCSDDLYVIMRWCWADEPEERPKFTQLREHIEALLTKDCNYLDLESIDVPLSTAASNSTDSGSNLIGSGQEDELRVDICRTHAPPYPFIATLGSNDSVPIVDLSDFRERLNKMKSTNI